VGERLAAIEPFFPSNAEALLPVITEIIEKGAHSTAVDTFHAQYKLQALQKQIAPVWEDIDLLVLPTAGTIYTIDEVNADPITLNSNLGIYTNFVNLLDLCALALPNGMQTNGLPTGITLLAPAFQDDWLGEMGTIFQYERDLPLGATRRPLPLRPTKPTTNPELEIELAVFGLHLTAQPLNHQLTDLGATFVRADKTAVSYRLFDVNGKPGAVLVHDGLGTAVDLEIWKLPVANLGYFVAKIPPPLGIGTVQLADGQLVKGFICEAYIADQAKEITQYGGWLAYLAEVDS
jgi:allophanate hydrolase